MKSLARLRRCPQVACAVLAMMGAAVSLSAEGTWTHTEGSAGGGRYSALRQIDRSNVGDLEVLWTYQHGDFQDVPLHPARTNRGTAFESTPIVVGRQLIFTTPFNRVISLDAATGTEQWAYDPAIDLGDLYANMIINRGVAAWSDETATVPDACTARVFLATLDARLIALDSGTGEPCTGFGEDGTVDLRADIVPLIDPHEYNMTSPPTVVGDVVVVGSSIADTVRRQAPSGRVRGYDARSGELRWTFHTIPLPGEPGSESWPSGGDRSGAANVWTTITADLERGLVFLPVSTPSPDYFGGDRPGDNLFSDSLVVLDAETGERRWHFQTVHHDLWDYDLASPPVLVTLDHAGGPRDAVALPTKQGFVFVFDRETGEPIWPIEERDVPMSPLPEEMPSPTQPFPTAPPAMVPQTMSEADLWEDHPERAACLKQFRQLRNEGFFTPASTEPTLVYPYSAGGANWSGATWDPERQLLVVPVNNIAHRVTLDRISDANVNRNDARPMSGLVRGLWFILTGRGTGLRYQLNPLGGRMNFAIDGIPCNRPPWGMLVGIDLRAGEIAWRAPASSRPDLPGNKVFGPALSTGSGLIFHGGTPESVVRVHDAANGELITSIDLPAGLHAGPVTYQLPGDERQILVVAPGGHIGVDSELGDWIIAYALPDGER